MTGIDSSLEERFTQGQVEIALDRKREGLVRLVKLDKKNDIHTLNPGSYIVPLTDNIYVKGSCRTEDITHLKKHSVFSICFIKGDYYAMKGNEDRSYVLVVEEDTVNIDSLPFTPIDDSLRSGTIKDIYALGKGMEIQKLRPGYNYTESIHNNPEVIIPLTFNSEAFVIIKDIPLTMAHSGIMIEPETKHGILSRSSEPTYILSVKDPSRS